MSDEQQFPVDSFKEAAKELRRPFTAAAVKFKVQATWPKQEPTGGLIVAYIDARLVVERLNLVVPHLWSDEYVDLGGGLMVCLLTIDGLTRKDVGEGQGKGLYSDALKRAAVKFGVGVSLYAIPKMILNKGADLKPRQTANGPTLELTDQGERNLRGVYARWLEAHGSKAFGDPLDHGDVADAQGDHEVDPARQEPSQPSSAPPAGLLPEETVEELFTLAGEARNAGMTTEMLAAQLVACGAGVTWPQGSPPSAGVVRAALGSLGPNGAEELRSRLQAFVKGSTSEEAA